MRKVLIMCERRFSYAKTRKINLSLRIRVKNTQKVCEKEHRCGNVIFTGFVAPTETDLCNGRQTILMGEKKPAAWLQVDEHSWGSIERVWKQRTETKSSIHLCC